MLPPSADVPPGRLTGRSTLLTDRRQAHQAKRTMRRVSIGLAARMTQHAPSHPRGTGCGARIDLPGNQVRQTLGFRPRQPLASLCRVSSD